MSYLLSLLRITVHYDYQELCLKSEDLIRTY